MYKWLPWQGQTEREFFIAIKDLEAEKIRALTSSGARKVYARGIRLEQLIGLDVEKIKVLTSDNAITAYEQGVTFDQLKDFTAEQIDKRTKIYHELSAATSNKPLELYDKVKVLNKPLDITPNMINKDLYVACYITSELEKTQESESQSQQPKETQPLQERITKILQSTGRTSVESKALSEKFASIVIRDDKAAEFSVKDRVQEVIIKILDTITSSAKEYFKDTRLLMETREIIGNLRAHNKEQSSAQQSTDASQQQVQVGSSRSR